MVWISYISGWLFYVSSWLVLKRRRSPRLWQMHLMTTYCTYFTGRTETSITVFFIRWSAMTRRYVKGLGVRRVFTSHFQDRHWQLVVKQSFMDIKWTRRRIYNQGAEKKSMQKLYLLAKRENYVRPKFSVNASVGVFHATGRGYKWRVSGGEWKQREMPEKIKDNSKNNLPAAGVSGGLNDRYLWGSDAQ